MKDEARKTRKEGRRLLSPTSPSLEREDTSSSASQLLPRRGKARRARVGGMPCKIAN